MLKESVRSTLESVLLESVALEEEVTFPNIKAACKSHFKTNLECDVLAGERGPSYADASQIQNSNVIHIRFIEKSSEPIQRRSEPAKDKCRSMAIENRPKIAKSSFAASVPLSPPIQGFALASSIKLLFSIRIMIKQIVGKY